jgi:hypothetical protein
MLRPIKGLQPVWDLEQKKKRDLEGKINTAMKFHNP